MRNESKLLDCRIDWKHQALPILKNNRHLELHPCRYDGVAHGCVVVHFCGSLPRFNPWTWKIVLGLRLDILLSDCNAACS